MLFNLAYSFALLINWSFSGAFIFFNTSVRAPDLKASAVASLCCLKPAVVVPAFDKTCPIVCNLVASSGAVAPNAVIKSCIFVSLVGFSSSYLLLIKSKLGSENVVIPEEVGFGIGIVVSVVFLPPVLTNPASSKSFML